MNGFKIKYTTIHFFLTIIILSLFYFTPFYRAQRVIIIYPLLLCWILLTNYLDEEWFSKSLWVFGLLASFVALDCIRFFTTNDIDILQSLIGHKILIYMWPIFLVYYIDHLDQFGKVGKVFLLMILVSAIFTTIGNIMYPEASRLLASFGASYDQADRVMYKEKYIGGYGLIFALAFLEIPLLTYAKQATKKWLYLLAGFFMVAVIFGAYTIAVGIAAVSVVLGLGKSRKINGLIISMIVLLVLIVTFKDQILMAIMNIGDMIGSQMLTKRARQLLYNTYSEDQGSMSRPLLYMNAFRNILDRPLLGLLTGATKTRYSDHSMLLEYFETNGIFGFVYVAMFCKTFSLVKNRLSSDWIKIKFLVWCLLIGVFLMVDQFSAAYEAGGVFLFLGPMLFLSAEPEERDLQEII